MRALKRIRPLSARLLTVGGRFVWLTLGLVAAGAARGQTPAPESSGVESSASTLRFQQTAGPLRVVVAFQPHPARLSDEPTLTVTVERAIGIDVVASTPDEVLGDFIARYARELPREIRNGQEVSRWIYTLDPVRAGECRVGSLVLTYRDGRLDGGGAAGEVQTKSFTARVVTSVDELQPSLDDLRDLAGPVELVDPPRSSAWWVLIASCAAACAVGGVAWWWRGRRAPLPVLSPSQRARRALETLAGDSSARARGKEFYGRLTDIVRRYIEESTGIRASERTTEEFLRAADSTRGFPSNQRELLREFLVQADLVKFAAARVDPPELDEALRRARQFVAGSFGEDAP